MKYYTLTLAFFIYNSILFSQSMVAPPDLVLTCNHEINIDKLKDYTDLTYGNVVLDKTLQTPIISLDKVCRGFCNVDSLTGYPGIKKACFYYNQLFDTFHQDQKYEMVWGFSGYALGSSNLKIKIQIDDYRKCGKGKINRIFHTEDNGATLSDTQTIWVVQCHPLYINANNPYDPNDDIVWPDSMVTVFGCGADVSSDTLIPRMLLDSTCQLITIEKFDEISTNDPSVCYKVLRKWVVIDWCQYDPFKNPNIGRWEYEQTILVHDTSAPRIKIFVQSCNESSGTNPNVVHFEILSDDQCTPPDWLFYSYRIDIDNDGLGKYNGFDCRVGTLNKRQYQAKDTVQFSDNPYALNHKDPFNPDGNYPIGTHKIVFEIEDGCGNISTYAQLFTLIASEKPKVDCKIGINITQLSSVGKANVLAEDLTINISDNCDQNLKPSFSKNSFVPSITFSCDDFEKEGFPNSISKTLEIWVKDLAGNTNSCLVNVEIQDHQKICNIDSTFINAEFFTYANKPIEQVDFNVIPGDIPTCSNEFNQMVKKGNTLTLNPDKIDQLLNGQDVWDVHCMDKYLSGKFNFNAIQKKAADLNSSGTITRSDISDYIKVILNTKSDFLNNNSKQWQFTNEDSIPKSTFELSNSIHKFYGFKIGDVNFDAFSQCKDTTEQKLPTLKFETKGVPLLKDKNYIIEFRSSNFKDLCCLQMDIQVDTQLIKIINTQINPRFNSKHLAIHSGHVSQIFLDANLIGLPNLLADEVVFSIEVEALKVTTNSNLAFSISDLKTKSIAYDIHGNPLDISLNNKVNAQININSSENLILYPNPMNEKLTIQWKEALDDSLIELFNSNGKLCFNSKFKSDIILNENNFKGPGMYFLKCTKGNKMITKKIIKS